MKESIKALLGISVLDTLENDLSRIANRTSKKSENPIALKEMAVLKEKKNQAIAIWRFIVENTHSELDYWGTTIDHKNNDPLDNRLKNLRIYNSAILNCTNISSKYTMDGMQYIHRQGKNKTNGYKVHYNLGGQTFLKVFQLKTMGAKKMHYPKL